jgi:gliding motility-associated-like protein
MGTLKVTIKILRIKDGEIKAESEKTKIDVDVIDSTASNTPPRIIAQKAIRTFVNRPVKIDFAYLTVVDPDDHYPTGFTLKLSSGSNFTITSSDNVVPNNNFVGTLVVNTIVNDGKADSQPFALQITVAADSTGDPPSTGKLPRFVTFADSPLDYSPENSQFLIASEVEIDDPDSETLLYAEVFFDAENFVAGKDQLTVQTSGNISSVFDTDVGMLVIFGQESLAAYQQTLRSLQYHFASDTLPSQMEKRINFRLNDGEHSSETRSKMITMLETIDLDIPNAFTPNDDLANDLWVIRPSRAAEHVAATVRVFDKRGTVLFETNDLSHFWDGKSNGQPLPPDSYFYTIEVVVGVHRIRQKGIVAILR